MDRILNMIFSVDGTSLISSSSDGMIARWTLPSQLMHGIREREKELNGMSNTIMDSFNELKQIQVHLPGGLSINDLLKEDDEDGDEEEGKGDGDSQNAEEKVSREGDEQSDLDKSDLDSQDPFGSLHVSFESKVSLKLIENEEEISNKDITNCTQNPKSNQVIASETQIKADDVEKTKDNKDQLALFTSKPDSTETPKKEKKEKREMRDPMEYSIDGDIENAVNQALLESDSMFCAVLDPSPIPVLDHLDGINKSRPKLNAEPESEDVLRITITTPSSTVRSNLSNESNGSNVQSTPSGDGTKSLMDQSQIDKESTVNAEAVIEKTQPIFIEKKGWRKGNLLEHLRENADNQLIVKTEERSISASVTSSVDIPSLEDLVKSVEVESQRDVQTKDSDIGSNDNQQDTDQMVGVKTSTEGMAEIMEQLRVLEMNEVMMNTTDIIDLNIVFEDDSKSTKSNHDGVEQKESSFPIPMTITIDTAAMIQSAVLKECEQREQTERKRIAAPTPPTEKNKRKRQNSLGSDIEVKSIRKSPKIKKLEKSLEMKRSFKSRIADTVESVENVGTDKEDENDEDTSPTNLIPFDQWEQMTDGGVRKGSENGKKWEEDGEVALTWKCFENNLMNIIGSAQQMKDIHALLRMKGLDQKAIDRKIRENVKVTTALKSVHESLEWIRDIIIDSEYSHSLM